MDESKTTEPTAESRIRLNVADYNEASSDYHHLSWRANQAKSRMARAVENLKALGADLEKLHVKST